MDPGSFRPPHATHHGERAGVVFFQPPERVAPGASRPSGSVAGARVPGPRRGPGRAQPGPPSGADFTPPPRPPVVSGPASRRRRAGTVAPLLGLCFLAAVWSWRAMTGSAAAPLLVEPGPAPGPGRPEVSATAPPGEPETAGSETGAASKGDQPGPLRAGATPGTAPGDTPSPPGDPALQGPEAAGERQAGAGESGDPASPAVWAQLYPGAAGAAGRPVRPGAAGGPSGPVLTVHVAGAVAQPGVYLLPAGARVVDAITAAGGPAPAAAPHALNLAAPLADGTRVLVPTQKELAAGTFVPARDGVTAAAPGAAAGTATGGGAGAAGGPQGRIDINRATAAELEALPGIGPALAQRIVADREVNGPFRRPQDLTRVPGIGEKTLAQLLPHITAGP
ncbi:ComEA family DNA-binding protein [Thermaerobacter subterraneus]|uniref:DNA uptake protein n=1 Tax=Thermaerobacter subterraneus DSM 13965 TaxID=867903 RepID=K6QDX2_9FIRM|nr:ComEA family DNA-binding protein [Thermaerobacter subterraneus]EKP94946.1 DNA uptake protein [Thermaerobacter subterraneus DSM 13965]